MTEKSVAQCSVDNCFREIIARGWCNKHYQRWRKYQDPLMTKICRGDDDNFAMLFWRQAILTADIERCWEWQGAKTSNGYGKILLHKKDVTTHRVAYELFYGESAGTLCVCHKCDNPSCINPHHLWLGTAGDNNRDRYDKGGYDTIQGNYYFTDEVIRRIRERVQQGESRRGIAEQMQVTHKTISQIVAHKTYAHVT